MGLWVDTDMGVDDLMAILLVADTRDIDGISLVFGCAPLDQVRQNARDAAAAYGWGFPLVEGADRAILGDIETATRILGPTGQPSRGARLPVVADPGPLPPALPALIAWLETQTNAVILALGPLTNIAHLALTRPDLLPRISRIIWMGGSAGRGNHTAHAEFNAIADPEAVAVVLSRDLPMVMVDLEACRQVLFDDTHLTDLPPVMADLVGGYLDIALSRGRAAMALYDPVAAAFLLRPDLFTVTPVAITVDLHDPEARGQTRVTPIGTAGNTAPTQIITALQAEAIRDLCLRSQKDPA